MEKVEEERQNLIKITNEQRELRFEFNDSLIFLERIELCVKNDDDKDNVLKLECELFEQEDKKGNDFCSLEISLPAQKSSLISIKVNQATVRLKLSTQTIESQCLYLDIADLKFVGEVQDVEQTPKCSPTVLNISQGNYTVVVNRVKSLKLEASGSRDFDKALELKTLQQYIEALKQRVKLLTKEMQQHASNEDFGSAKKVQQQLEKHESKLTTFMQNLLEDITVLNDFNFLKKINRLNQRRGNQAHLSLEKENEQRNTLPATPETADKEEVSPLLTDRSRRIPEPQFMTPDAEVDLEFDDFDERPLPALMHKIQELQQNDQPLDHFEINASLNNSMFLDQNSTQLTGKHVYKLESARSQKTHVVSLAQLREAFHDVELSDDLPELEDIPEALFLEYKDLIDFMPSLVLRCLLSAHPKLRLVSMTKIERLIARCIDSRFKNDLNEETQPQMSVIKRIFQLLKMSLSDHVEKIVSKGVFSLLSVVNSIIQVVEDKEEFTDQISECLQQLLLKLGTFTARLVDKISTLIDVVCKDKSWGVVFTINLVTQKKNARRPLIWKALAARLMLMKHILAKFDFSSMVTGDLMSFLVENNAFLHPNAQVRELAKAVTVIIYQTKREEVLPFLKNFRKAQVDDYKASFAAAVNVSISESQIRKQGFGIENVRTTHVAHQYRLNELSEPKQKGKKILKQSSVDENNMPISARSAVSKNSSAREPFKLPDIYSTTQESVFTAEIENKSAREDEKCQFCDMEDQTFADEEALDIHYWKKCPMLTSCSKCDQIIEISFLNQHLIEECSHKLDHKQCNRCGEAIENKFYQKHVSKNRCQKKLPLNMANRCPLCHQNIGPNEDGWKMHLLIQKCSFNIRS